MSLSLPAPPLADAPILVGYSGGLDSTVLLHQLANDVDARARGLRAIHVHHGLNPDADAWATQCVRACGLLDVPLLVVHVQVERGSGLGLEGAARAARHRAFNDALRDREILALAHHRDDQAETFLLRALRGSGVDGLASMRPWRAYARGWLWRPLLDHPRDALRTCATEHALQWIEDPANADLSFDRMFLRNRLLPLLRERWPHAGGGLARSADLSAQAADLLAAEDVVDLARVQRSNRTLDADALQTLPNARRARVLRRWIAELGLPPLPGQGVTRIETDLLAARRDAEACFEWAGARVLRWRHLLYAAPACEALPHDFSCEWDGRAPLQLPTGDLLELAGAVAFETCVWVHARHGGERIALPGRSHRHALKQLLQVQGVPPWEREHMPLLSATDGELLAAGDAIVSARLDTWLRDRGARLHWRREAMA